MLEPHMTGSRPVTSCMRARTTRESSRRRSFSIASMNAATESVTGCVLLAMGHRKSPLHGESIDAREGERTRHRAERSAQDADGKLGLDRGDGPLVDVFQPAKG